MAVIGKGEITLANSAQFNATLWAARASGLEQFADDMIRDGQWVEADGRLTRQLELDAEQSALAIKLACGIASGRIAVHQSYRQGAVEILFGRN